jgi:hypothetical protein
MRPDSASAVRRRTGAVDLLNLFVLLAVATVVGMGVHAAVVADPDLETIRRVSASYGDIAEAKAAGYTFEVPRCRDNPPEGGMGWHYANPEFLDDTVVVDKPEVLLYEPLADGSLQLVGVEYVILYKDRARDAAPPVLMGQQFKHNDGDQLWMLHVWLHRENPNGLFATWNPTVSCAHSAH